MMMCQRLYNSGSFLGIRHPPLAQCRQSTLPQPAVLAVRTRAIHHRLEPGQQLLPPGPGLPGLALHQHTEIQACPLELSLQ